LSYANVAPRLPQKFDKEAKTVVDAAVEEAKTSPEPELKDLWTDIYYKGTEPSFMRGREREEVCSPVSDTRRIE
jgi:TPP-dependent pyruvate/acetoin dehydrogenase alpha subunit